jgi:hypothetical protein
MLWPGETFVDFAHGLNTSIRELRGALSHTERKGKAATPGFLRRGLLMNLPDDFDPHDRATRSRTDPACD